MPCLVLILALVSPRLALIGVWLGSDWLGRAFEGKLLPIIGFFFLPWTTLAFAGMWAYGTNEVTGFEWAIIALAFLGDIGAIGGAKRGRGD
jgi:hypothetical protein